METVIYYGTSMHPTFRHPDLLHVVPYGEGELPAAGDVVVFLPPGEEKLLSHRVISVMAGAVRTRGDNNLHDDRWLLTPAHIRGRVVSFERAGRTRALPRGTAARLTGARARAGKLARSGISRLLSPAYMRISRSGVVQKLLPASFRPRIVALERPGGKELVMLLGGRIIGRLLPGRDEWQIRRPWRLFIDVSSLPGHGEGNRQKMPGDLEKEEERRPGKAAGKN